MERMWRKVNQGLTSLSKNSSTQPVGVHSTDTASSAGFGDVPPNVAAVGTSSTTITSAHHTKSMSSSSKRNTIQPSTSSATTASAAAAAATTTTASSQHHRRQTLNQNQQQTMNRMGAATTAVGAGAALVFGNTASSERRRRRRKRSRPRREGGSGGSSVIHHPIGLPPNSTVAGSHHQHQHQTNTDISLKQRAVAKLKLFNFHLNWDLHMTQCKPCGPRSSGNILTRRLCRNRRNREDNELYRSNSFKFERFERKEGAATDILGTESLRKKNIIDNEMDNRELCPLISISDSSLSDSNDFDDFLNVGQGKIQHFMEIIENYWNEQFRKNVRLTRETVSSLVDLYESSVLCPNHNHGGNRKVGLHVANTIT